MANIKELIAGIEVEMEAAVKREQKARKEVEVILAVAQQEGRSALSKEEDARCEQLFEAIELAKAQQDGVQRKLARAKKVEAEEAEYDARMADRSSDIQNPVSRADSGTPKRVAEFKIGVEERTYSPETDPSGRQFLMDVAKQFSSNDVMAQARLQRHMQEERVERGSRLVERAGVGTDAFSGLVVPQYLLDMVAPAVANLRPFADVANKHPLPANGMSVQISRITTASSADLQAAQLDTVDMTDMDDTLLTASIQTAAGSQLVSRQALERGQGIEDTVMQDLVARHDTLLDSTLINQATYGLSAVANDNDYTSGSPTAAALYPFIVGAASQVTGALLGFGSASHVIMHPRRWYWMQSELTTAWPFLTQAGIDPRAGGAASAAGYNQGNAGRLPCGLDVVMDANVPTDKGTNEDEIYVVPWREMHLWEDPGAPMFIRAEQPNVAQLGVMLVVYSYFAYTFQRYTNAVQKVSDTGLIAPTGF